MDVDPIPTGLNYSPNAIVDFAQDFVRDVNHLSAQAAGFFVTNYINPVYNLARTASLQPHVTQAILPRLLNYQDAVQKVAPHANDYWISEKSDGVRAWLCLMPHPIHLSEYIALFINRAGHIWRAPACLGFTLALVPKLRTRLKMLLFDGELICHQQVVTYLIFDLLALNHTSHVVSKCHFTGRQQLIDTLLKSTGLGWQDPLFLSKHLICRKPWLPLLTWATNTTAFTSSLPNDGFVLQHVHTPPFVTASQSETPLVFKLKPNHTVDVLVGYDPQFYTSDWYSLSYYTHDQYLTETRRNHVASSSTGTRMCGFGLYITHATHSLPVQYVIYNVQSFYGNDTMTQNMQQWCKAKIPHDILKTGKLVVEFKVLGTVPPEALERHFNMCQTCRQLSAVHHKQIVWIEAEPIKARTDKSAANNTSVIIDTLQECLNPTMNEEKLRQLL